MPTVGAHEAAPPRAAFHLPRAPPEVPLDSQPPARTSRAPSRRSPPQTRQGPARQPPTAKVLAAATSPPLEDGASPS
eukprot:3582754-Heterocapsa_arctica.AAC.1